MSPSQLRALLQQVSQGEKGVEAAFEALSQLPVEENLEFARLDHHRSLRQGFPEVVYGEGKTPQQIVAIAKKLEERGAPVLVTRVAASVWEQIAEELPSAHYHALARLIHIDGHRDELSGSVGVLCAGTSDLPVAEEAALCLEAMGGRVERMSDIGVAGLHRLLNRLADIRSHSALIVVAGMEGALPSVVAGLVSVPVIAVPTSVGYGASFGGLAALLGMLNSCSNGVAVVNIDNGFGAASFAASVLRSQGASKI
ncbi:nickel pincer cofactor biosynthesis protein LarB [bacterium]|nr:MAG: nickel pincer cofactor biosynthesis protein LarB [bacterium]